MQQSGLSLSFVFMCLDPIPSPEERLIWSQSSFVFSFVLGPGTDSTSCADIRFSLCTQFTHAWFTAAFRL